MKLDKEIILDCKGEQLPEVLIMADEVEAFAIEDGGGVTFAQLQGRITGFAGEYAFPLIRNESIILWSGMSITAIRTFAYLFSSLKLLPVGTSLTDYLVDGATLNVPIAKNPDHIYKTPRWMPVVMWHPTKNPGLLKKWQEERRELS